MFPTPGQHAAEANDRIDAHASDARTRRIEAFELLWSGNAYDARPSFWDNRVPLRERKPAVQSGILRASGQRLAHMVFGDRAFPSVTVQTQAFGLALDAADVDALSALVTEVVTLTKMRTAMRGYLTEGLKTGTSVALCELRAGKPSVRILPAKWCTARFDEAGRVTRLVVQYRYRDGDRDRWYRREIGDGLDLVRVAVDVPDSGVEPEWSKVPVEGTPRPISFVPVVWTRYGCEAVEDGYNIDGHPLCEGVEDELLALDMELSQLYRNALYNGEPQMVRTGVGGDPMSAGAAMGGASGRAAADGAGSFSWLNSMLPKGWTFGGPSTVARKGPGQVWDLPTGGDAKLLESSGSGAQIIKGAVDEYRRIVTDSMGVVIADPQTLGKGDLSARALTLMFGPMLDTASAIRVDYGEAFVLILDTLLRLMSEHVTGVYVATLDAARTALAKMRRPTEAGGVAWVATPLALSWGEFFEPSWGDVSSAIDAASKATGGRAVLSRRAAMRLVAPVVGVDDLDAEDAEIEREAGGDAETMRATLAAAGADDAPPMAPEASVQDTALNGAQVEALVSLAEKVTARLVPLETAVRIAMRGFQIAESDAREMLAPAAEMAPVAPPVTDGPRAL
jgi:hypothetical protein